MPACCAWLALSEFVSRSPSPSPCEWALGHVVAVDHHASSQRAHDFEHFSPFALELLVRKTFSLSRKPALDPYDPLGNACHANHTLEWCGVRSYLRSVTHTDAGSSRWRRHLSSTFAHQVCSRYMRTQQIVARPRSPKKQGSPTNFTWAHL